MSVGEAVGSWNEDHVPVRGPGGRRLRAWLHLLLGAGFLAVGLWTGRDFASAWLHFHGAPRVAAVVETAEYTKPDLRQNPSHITVLAAGDRETATVDDPVTAPEGLSPGDRVVVLTGPSRPGHVLLPSQLHRTAAALPVLWAVLGLAGCVSGAVTMVRRRADPLRG